MNLKIALFTLFGLFAFPLFAQEKTYDLYLLIGQSNMAGRGVVEACDTIVNPHVFTLDKNNNWIPSRDPIHFDKSVAGVGLGRTFGIEMAKANPTKKIGLIPCAVGGSPIDSWKPGAYDEATKTHPFDDMEIRLEKALENGSLKGILWHQGESDSNPEKCDAYKQKLEELIQQVRVLGENETAPFVAGEFGQFKIKSNKKLYPNLKPAPAEVVMSATKELVKKDGNAAFVKSNGLHHKGDKTHFDSKSYRKFGKRYARKMLQLQQK